MAGPPQRWGWWGCKSGCWVGRVGCLCLQVRGCFDWWGSWEVMHWQGKGLYGCAAAVSRASVCQTVRCSMRSSNTELCCGVTCLMALS